MSRQTITDAYLQEQQQLHQNPNYGIASLKFAPVVADIIKQTGFTTLTDYGAGKKRLYDALEELGVHENLVYQPYDPAFPEYGAARPAEIVCCIDVLEHIEPELLDNVLEELADLIQGAGFFTVHMGPASKTLSDGRNAHLIQEPTSWWLPRLCRHFEINMLQQHSVFGRGFMVGVQGKRR